MVYEVILAEPAIEDINQTVGFITVQSSVGAARWLDGIQMIIGSLNEMPFRAAKIPETRLFQIEYRHLMYHSHRIIFHIDEAINTVFVVRVYHTSRAPLRIEDSS